MSRYSPTVRPSGIDPLAVALDSFGDTFGRTTRAAEERARQQRQEEREEERYNLQRDLSLAELGGGTGPIPTRRRAIGTDPNAPTTTLADDLDAFSGQSTEPQVLALPGQFVPQLGGVTKRAILAAPPVQLKPPPQSPQEVLFGEQQPLDTGGLFEEQYIEENDPDYIPVGSGAYIKRPEARRAEAEAARLAGIERETLLKGRVERQFRSEDEAEQLEDLAGLDGLTPGERRALAGGVPWEVVRPRKQEWVPTTEEEYQSRESFDESLERETNRLQEVGRRETARYESTLPARRTEAGERQAHDTLVERASAHALMLAREFQNAPEPEPGQAQAAPPNSIYSQLFPNGTGSAAGPGRPGLAELTTIVRGMFPGLHPDEAGSVASQAIQTAKVERSTRIGSSTRAGGGDTVEIEGITIGEDGEIVEEGNEPPETGRRAAPTAAPQRSGQSSSAAAPRQTQPRQQPRGRTPAAQPVRLSPADSALVDRLIAQGYTDDQIVAALRNNHAGRK